MQDLDSIKKKIIQMARIALDMWKITHQAFLEHDTDLISIVLEKEDRLNLFEKELAQDVFSAAKATPDRDERNKFIACAEIAEDLELIGDYCKDILERVQIKIEEKLLFSEGSVKEYEDLYKLTEAALEEVALAFAKDKIGLLKKVLKNGIHLDNLVDEYRQRHNQRLIDGICSPLSCNMFLNMLDFTAAVYYHTRKIAKNMPKIINE